MQLLADVGYEFGEHQGLGYIKGRASKLEINQISYPLPHMGWNNLIHTENSRLFKDIDDDATFYFVHSYHFEPENVGMKTVNTVYGKEFVAAFSYDNIHAVQFHPEKSQYYGLKLLDNFLKF
jgi:glutamine amidotransferase